MLIPVDVETDFPQWVAGNESGLEGQTTDFPVKNLSKY